MISIEYYCSICGIFSAILGGLLTQIFCRNWRNRVIKFFKINYPDEIIEDIIIPPLATTFWMPFFISIFYGYFAFPLLNIPEVQSIDFITKNNIYVFIFIVLIFNIFLIFLGMTLSILTNKRLVTITPSTQTKFLGEQYTNKNILVSEISSISYQYMKVMKINLKNGTSFSFGAKNIDNFYKKLNSMLTKEENK
jgi:hypothetical protein